MGKGFAIIFKAVKDIAFPKMAEITYEQKADETLQQFCNGSIVQYCVRMIGNSEVLICDVNQAIIHKVLQKMFIASCHHYLQNPKHEHF